MPLFVESLAPAGAPVRQTIRPGANRLRAEPGVQYRVFDDQAAMLEAAALVRRIGSSLVVEGIAPDTSVELVGFFRDCPPENPCTLAVQNFPGAATAEITPVSVPLGALQDGSFVMHAPAALATVVPVPPEAEPGGRTGLYLGLGLLGLGAAAGGGGGGSGSSPTAVGAPPDTPRLTSPRTVTSNNPLITGVGTAGSVVTVSLDLGDNGSTEVSYLTTAGADGRWSVTVGADAPSAGALPQGRLPDGQVRILARATNGAGTSAGLMSELLLVDATAPIAPVINPVAGDNTVSPAEAAAGVQVSGRAEAGTAVTINWLGLARSVSADAAGAWSTNYTTAQIAAAGNDRIVRASATDAVGNVSAESSLAVTLTTARPGPPVIAAVASDDRINRAESLASGGVQVSGQSVPGGSVQLEWGSTPARRIQADAAGNWSARYLSAELPADGATSIRAIATDSAGNTGDTATRGVLIDRVAPATPTIAAIAGNDVISRDEALAGVSIAGTAEAGTSVLIQLGNTSRTTTSNSAGVYSASFSSAEIPAAGAIAVTARASDAAGNTSSDASRPARVSTTAPATPTIAIIAGNDIINRNEANAGITVSGNSEPGTSISLTLGSMVRTLVTGGNGTFSSPFAAAELPSADGSYLVRATAVNGDGSSSAEVTRALTIDRTPPAIAIAAVTGENIISFAERTAGVTISGTVEAGASVSVTWASATRTAVGTGGTYAVTFDAASVPGSGVSAVSVVATDAAGNTSTPASVSVVVDTTATSYRGSTGADTLTLNKTGIENLVAPGANVDGRSGPDTLTFSGADITLNLLAIPSSAITSFERLNLTGTGNNTVRLTVTDVLDMASSNEFNSGNGWSGLPTAVTQRQLVIDGNAGDLVEASGGWVRQTTTVSNAGQTYVVYTSGSGGNAAMLIVDSDITRNIV